MHRSDGGLQRLQRGDMRVGSGRDLITKGTEERCGTVVADARLQTTTNMQMKSDTVYTARES